MRPKHLAQRTTTAKPTRDIASRDFRRFASLHTDRKGRGDCRPWGRASSKAEVARFKVCASKICKAFPRHANHVYQKHLNLWKKKRETFPGGKIAKQKGLPNSQVVPKSRDRLYSSFNFSQSFRGSGISMYSFPNITILGSTTISLSCENDAEPPNMWKIALVQVKNLAYWYPILRPSSTCCQMLPKFTGWQFAQFWGGSSRPMAMNIHNYQPWFLM